MTYRIEDKWIEELDKLKKEEGLGKDGEEEKDT